MTDKEKLAKLSYVVGILNGIIRGSSIYEYLDDSKKDLLKDCENIIKEVVYEKSDRR